MISGRLAPHASTGRVEATARFAFSLSPRALLLLAAGTIWIVPAFVDRRALLMILAWDALIVALAAIDLARLPRPSELRVTRKWNAPLSIGATAQVILIVENDSESIVRVSVSDSMPAALREEPAVLHCRAVGREAAESVYDVHPRERGDQAVGRTAVSWSSPWQLVERWGTALNDQTVRVYPDLAEGREEALYLIRSRQIALEKRRTRYAGLGREFESLRDYRPGDEQRDICWSVSARRAKVVTKVYQPERSQAVWMMLDAGRLLRARVADRSMLDISATAALTLAQVALASGDRVGLMAYGRRLQHRLAPNRAAGHLRTLVEALATVRADAVDADHAGAAGALLAAQKRRALIVWFTEIAETAGVPDVIEQALTMTARHVVLFVVMRNAELHDLASSIPSSDADLYRIVAAQEALERRDALLHGLRQRGALVLEASAGELSAGVVDRYLETKERGVV